MQKWNKKNIPHKGWEWCDVIDLKECATDSEIEYEQCEMCDNERIRFVHIMKHPEYYRILRVGCVCAEKMSGNYENPQKKENELRNKAKRRYNFNRVQWNFNEKKKSFYKKYKGQIITIVQSKYGNWGVFFEGNRIWEYEKQKILTFEFAEKVAFEIFDKNHTTKEERYNNWY